MIKTDRYPTETVRSLEKRIEVSTIHHERSSNDPLEFVFPLGDERSTLMEIDQLGLEDATSRQDYGEVVEFASDLAYLSFLEDTGDVPEYTATGIDAIKEKLQDRSLSPGERLALRSKLLDIASLQAFDKYHSAAPSLDREGKRSAQAILEATSKTIIMQGAKTLAEMQRALVELKKGTKEWERDAEILLVGRMFELLFATNRRREIYEREEYDEVLVIGSTEFQDRPSVQFVPNHNFDFMEVAAYGRITRLVQCKTRDKGYDYDGSIEKVSGRSIGRFFDDPVPYIEAIQLAVGDSDDPRYEPMMKKAVEKINSLFARDHSVAGSRITALARS